MDICACTPTGTHSAAIRASKKSSLRSRRKTRVNKHGNGSEEILRRIKEAERLPRGRRLWSRRVVSYSAHDAGFPVLRDSKLGDSLCRDCPRDRFSDSDVPVLALRTDA